jgi:murein DD-endopeptidase MepM/ murein hydrolase activator NlpD
MSQEEWRDQSAYSQVHEPTFVKLSFGGRQVWIDHGNGIVTAYNHLSRIDRSIRAGREVGRGQRLGWAGNSGLWGETLGNQDGCHLHLEIWIDGRYLGYGMDVADIRKYFSWIFSVSE